MNRPINSARRKFVISSASVGAALVVVGTTGCTNTLEDRQLKFASLAAADEELTRLALAKELISNAKWNWPQTLIHCAQSIEYSMSGFPQSKSKLFQNTLGSAALGMFSWRGHMTHDLAEPIAGAPLLEIDADQAKSLERLRTAILNFTQWPGPLKPHFAYGELAKPEYELAHAMHIANHLSAFRDKV